MENFSIGVDWAVGDDKTCVVIAKREGDIVTIHQILHGEVAEFIAELWEEHKKLEGIRSYLEGEL